MSLSTDSHRSVDVCIVDNPRAAGASLRAHLPAAAPGTDAESTHILCRHAAETSGEFGARVRRRLERIQRTRRVRSLRYVVGADAVAADGTLPVLGSLLPLLDAQATLTVVGPGSRQSTLFQWIDALLHRRERDVAVQAQLYADAGDCTRPRSGVRPSRAWPAHPSAAVSVVPARPGVAHTTPRLGTWLLEPSTVQHAPDSVRAFAG